MLDMIVTILTALLVLDCLLLLLVILVQRGKGGGLAGALGGLGAETAFGTRAGSTARKATIVLAVLFVALSGIVYILKSQADRVGPPGAPAGDTAPAQEGGG